jgi:hypothetical protein
MRPIWGLSGKWPQVRVVRRRWPVDRVAEPLEEDLERRLSKGLESLANDAELRFRSKNADTTGRTMSMTLNPSGRGSRTVSMVVTADRACRRGIDLGTAQPALAVYAEAATSLARVP